MSRVDTRLPAGIRASLRDDVRHYLPYFLSKASVVNDDSPVDNLANLLHYPKDDLRRLGEFHFAASKLVQEFVADLPMGLRRPATTTDRPRVISQVVTGPVDWGATIRLRAVSGGADVSYVTRPSLRIYDSPENRALRWAVEELDRLLRKVAGDHREPDEAETAQGEENPVETTGHESGASRKARPDRAPLERRIQDQRSLLAGARKVSWLSSVPVLRERPDAYSRMRLKASRLKLYRQYLSAVIEGFDRYVFDPTTEALAELVAERYFDPGRDWQLFEVSVAFRLVDAFEQAGGNWARAGLLVGGQSGRPYAVFNFSDDQQIRLWYQRWPQTDDSAQLAVLAHHGIVTGGSRPDVVIERFISGKRVDLLLLELKASQNHATLASGVLQVLGYLHDQGWMSFQKRVLGPFAWVVGLDLGSFPSASINDDLAVWIVPGSEVVERVVARMTM